MGPKRRQQRTCSAFLEDLPNEIFVEIFSYLNGVDATYAFSSLNTRFTLLLRENCDSFDFQSISKFIFDLVHQSRNTKQWKLVQISDDERTPNLVEYFFHIYSLMNDFPNLLSLTMINLDLQRAYSILSEISSLKTLRSLTLSAVCGQ